MTAAARKTTPKYACALCGKRSPADEMVFSTHTRARYCGRDFLGCRARYERKRRSKR